VTLNFDLSKIPFVRF